MEQGQHNKALFKSEYSMGQYDFIRLDKILTLMDEYAIQVQLFNPDSLLLFYGILWELYKNFRSILFESIRTKFEKQFSQIRKDVYDEVSRLNSLRNKGVVMPVISISIMDELDKIQMDLLEIRQIIGLGITVEKIESMKTKLERAMGVLHE